MAAILCCFYSPKKIRVSEYLYDLVGLRAATASAIHFPVREGKRIFEASIAVHGKYLHPILPFPTGEVVAGFAR